MAKNATKNKKSVEEIQNDIFRKMPAARKLKLASDYSMFILRSRNNVKQPQWNSKN